MPPVTRSRQSAAAESPKPSSRAASAEAQHSTSPAYVPSHPIFFDSRNDIVLRTEGTSFGFRAAILREASTVFSAMLEDGVGEPKAPTEDGCLIIDIDDDVNTLETYLVFIHPQVGDPDVKLWKELKSFVPVLATSRAQGNEP